MEDWAMVQGLNNFIVRHGEWVAFAGAVLIFGAFGAYQFKGVVERKKLIGKRQLVSENAWFDAYYPIAPEERNLVRDVLGALAEEIGVEWTKLRPADTFEDVLRINRRFSPHDDLEGAEREIASLAEKLGIADKGLPGFTGVLKDFLDRWVSLCGGEPPEKPISATAC